MKVAIIIPSHNRKQNLACNLAALSRQTVRPDEIIVVDDRSTDSTHDVISYHLNPPLSDEASQLYVKYIYNPPAYSGWNASIPRNLGARAVSPDIDLLWFLDSDVILPPDAVGKTLSAYRNGDPHRVLIGSYDWLPAQEVTVADVLNRFDDMLSGKLPTKQIERKGMIGQKDIRQVSFDKAKDSSEMFSSFTDGLACFGGYLLLPKKIYYMAGGYDEGIGAGCEDGDFGITLYEMGVPFSYLKETKGYHIPHEQPDGRMPIDVVRNVEKLNTKHNVDVIHQSGKAYREWGIDWNPPPEFYNFDEKLLAKWKKDWQTDKMEFDLKVNKI